MTVEFDNGYSLTLDAGVEIGLFVAIAEAIEHADLMDKWPVKKTADL